MELSTLEKLQRIQRYATRYEIIATNGERRYLIQYNARRSAPGLIASVKARGPLILRRLEIPPDAPFSWIQRGRDAAIKLGEWSIRFSGRTQRDAILEGELEFLQ